MEKIVADTHRMMNDFKGKREGYVKRINEHLAKSESSAKKDFDGMMADIILKQNEREDQVRKCWRIFAKKRKWWLKN